MLYVRAVLFVMCFMLIFVSNSFAGLLTVRNAKNIRLFGFVDYESGYNNNSKTPFYGSNTAYNSTSSSFNSREQARLGILVRNNTTLSNITLDSWPDNFSLMLAYVQHRLSKNVNFVIGRDWSVVNMRYFKYSSYTLRPYVVGFEGSKRTNQFKIIYHKDFGSWNIRFAFAMEDRLKESGVVEGKSKISNSGITAVNTDFPAGGLNVKINFNTSFGKPSQLMSFYELAPVYLEGQFGRIRKYPYTFGFGSRLNIAGGFLIFQYIFEHGMSGIAGIKGNGLKTYSYIYYKNMLISKRSNTIGVEISKRLFGFTNVVIGYADTNFEGKVFLKNELKNSHTIFASLAAKVTKVTTLFLLYSHIVNDVAVGEGEFSKKKGYNFVCAYRYYF